MAMLIKKQKLVFGIILCITLLTSLVPAINSAYADEMSREEKLITASQTPEKISSHSLDELPEGSYAPGEALLVFKTKSNEQEIAQPSQSDIQGNSAADANALTDLGFDLVNCWDISVAPSAQEGPDSDYILPNSRGNEDAGSTENTQVLQVKKAGASTQEILNELANIEEVQVAGPNFYYETMDFPNDTFYSKQHSLNAPNGSLDFESVYGAESSDENPIVAIVDTGIDYTNPDLAGVMWENPGDIGIGPAGSHGLNAITGEYDPMPDSDFTNSHGTHCAGIAAAQANNAKGIAGVAGSPKANTEIMGFRVTGSDGSGFFTSVIAASYEFMIKAKQAGENIVSVNNSWGAPYFAPHDLVLDYVVTQAGQAGIISVFAAGNSDMDAGELRNTVMMDSPYAVMVAASNEQNMLTNFSNYSITGVDVAAPGSKILSTISTTNTDTFNPLLSKQSGKSLDYYTNIEELRASPTTHNFKSVLVDADGTELPEEAQDALTISATPDGFINTQLGDEKSISVKIDYPTLSSLGYTQEKLLSIKARINWDIKNPFFNGTGLNSEEYAAQLAAVAYDLQRDDTVRAYPSLLNSTGENIVAPLTDGSPAFVGANRDNFSIRGGVLSSTSSDDSTLTVQVDTLVAGTNNVAIEAKPRTWLLSGFGIGCVASMSDPQSDLIPYGYMSGTSMATPAITGTVAELSALFPNETPLEIRGRICGGTKPLTPDTGTATPHEIASSGRFSFEVGAADETTLNANTWALSGDSTTLTLHGRGLDDASLSVDGSPVALTSSSNSTLTFEVDATLLDGQRHRFDVSNPDSTPGETRTFNASYKTPLAKSLKELTPLSNLPQQAASNTSVLLSTPGALLVADSEGEYLYSNANPENPSSEWTQLNAPGNPWTGIDGKLNKMRYVYSNGYVHAFAYDKDLTQENTANYYGAVYDIKNNTWTDFELLYTDTETTVFAGINLSSLNGQVYAFTASIHLKPDSTTENKMTVLSGPAGSNAVTHKLVPAPDPSLPDAISSFYGMFAVNGEILGIGSIAESMELFAPTSIGIASYDIENNEWVLKGRCPDVPFGVNPMITAAYSIAPSTGAGNGCLVVSGDADYMPDICLFTLDENEKSKTVDLAYLGLDTPAGPNIECAAVHEGKLYLGGLGSDPEFASDSAKAATDVTAKLFAVPDSVNDQLTALEVSASATVEGSGSATVSDWRGIADQTLTSARSGDTIYYNAKSAAESKFIGWFNEDGDLLSTEAAYSTITTSDTALTAKFEGTPGPVPPVPPVPPAPPVPDPQPAAPVLPGTGDSALPLAVVAILGALSTTGLLLLSRKKNG